MQFGYTDVLLRDLLDIVFVDLLQTRQLNLQVLQRRKVVVYTQTVLVISDLLRRSYCSFIKPENARYETQRKIL